jgi:protein involved in polysaccharide export with SLBB domain
MFRQHVACLVALVTVVIVVFPLGVGLAGPQEKGKDLPPAIESGKSSEKRSPASAVVQGDKAEAAVEKLLAGYDLKPHPLLPIPDDPPPHEGAMISLPHIIEPPDLLLVEVLDALPGRPISGERLVKPDGTISLGFYGEIPVRGLTLEQVKIAIIMHLRPFIADATLGLIAPDLEEMTASPPREKPAPPEVPKQGESPLEAKGKAKPRTSTFRLPSSSRPLRPRAASSPVARRPASVRPVLRTASQEQAQDKAAPAPAPNQLTVPAGGSGKVTITIQVDGQGLPLAQPVAEAPPVALEGNERVKLIPPEKSDKVFVDVTAYNSKNYFVLGDIEVPGRFPCTGHETVLDALQFAGGFLATAEPKDIRLVRPARGGNPARTFKIDLTAIQEKGDITSNYQLFPGDRLIVGRNEVVKRTVEIDRLAAPILSITGVTMQEALLLRAMQNATLANRDALLKEFVDFWTKELARPGGVKLDEQTLREAFIRKMNLPPAPVVNPAPR